MVVPLEEHHRGAIGTRGRRRRPRAGDQHETGLRPVDVLNVVGQHRQTVAGGGEGAGKRGVDLPDLDTAGCLGVAERRFPARVGQVLGKPPAALRLGMRMAGNRADRVDPGVGPGEEGKPDQEHNLGGDLQKVTGGQFVQSGRHRALDRVLERDESPVGVTLADRVQSSRHVR